MKLDPIVVSLLDTDLYKFNMDQVIFHKHTDLSGEYYFRCRNEGVKFTREMFDEINAQIDHLCSLTFKKEELDYLRAIRFIKNDYVEFLRLWHPIRDYVETGLSDEGELSIVVRGPLFSAMQFEIYLLEIVNEVYFRMRFDYETLRAMFPENPTLIGAKRAAADLDALIARTAELQTDLETLRRTGNLSDLAALSAGWSETVQSMRAVVTGSLKPAFDTIASDLTAVLNTVEPLLRSVQGGVEDLALVLDGAQSTVTSVDGALRQLRAILSRGSDTLSNLIARVEAATPDEQLQTLIDLLGGDAARYGSFFSALVDMEVQEVYSVNSYGTAMAPFYSVLALWVGGVILVAILKVHVDAEKFPAATESQRFFGRFALFFLVGQLQAAVIVLGDLHLLGVEAANPWLLWVAAAVTSLVFVLLIYALTLSFGDIGKAIVVVVMVLQIAGSSGSYPIEILPEIFSKIYLFFPFPYAINAMREAICGVYQQDYLIYLGKLLLFGVLGLLIGLVVRRPFMNMNEFVEEKLEETEVI